MARSSKLKVYRTPVGFHDAYVAAPSQKAALKAWGSGHDLFARGVAEIVTDPTLTAAALASPGTVVKRSRGTAAEQIAALPKDKVRTAPRADTKPPQRKPRRPSRRALDEAEAKLAAVEQRFADAREALRTREQALARERRDLEKDETAAVDRAQEQQAEAERAYREAMDAWEG